MQHYCISILVGFCLLLGSFPIFGQQVSGHTGNSGKGGSYEGSGNGPDHGMRFYEESDTNKYQLEGRKLEQYPKHVPGCGEAGRVVLDIEVDRNGKVLSARVGRGTTSSDTCLINASTKAARKVRWNANESAPEIQKGKIYYDFREH